MTDRIDHLSPREGAMPAMPALDALLHGAVDLHHHGFPEFTFAHPTRQSDAEELRQAAAAGMAGIVMKSHFFPTTTISWHLNQMGLGAEAFPSITMNPCAGGFLPVAVEAAARQGARVLFMPTWGAEADQRRGGMSRYLGGYLESAKKFLPEDGLTVLDSAGRIRPEVTDCLAIAAAFGMMVATGHISPRESVAVVTEARRLGVREVMFQHPDSHSIGATREDIRAIVAAGGTVEFCAIGFTPAFQRLPMAECLEIIREVGAENVVLTTDCFFGWMPPAPELLRMTLGSMLHHGLSHTDAALLVRDNPRRLLGLPAWAEAARAPELAAAQ
ncbi:DUF6282 family protein [Roseomonas marmotae]|uniref:Amidohydrolase family protein n=1 Tax=Roseomonas marmotae TaxID=2768161 RepID=A0ABS3K780_9PROT|nr:DUF6282 family protein [Roseomonas marmotae]MBO1073334.1 hypothetical protein [Roseomonas marmotae]QTI79051.1 hypothetical protein IAI58_15670 [Roseomonas marmotae]